METTPSFTKYEVTPTSDICTNPNCAEALPHYAGIGEKVPGRKCYLCGKPMRRIQGEPRGTYHPPR